ncbi:MAG: nucleotidyltransferase domain-containing protein [bacterium]
MCEEFTVERLHFFGSVLRDDFSAESNVDVLVEFSLTHPYPRSINVYGSIDAQK